MATISFKGLDTLIAKLEKLNGFAHGQMKMAIYDGAAEVKKALVSTMNTIPVQDEFVRKGHMRDGITSEQKQGIINGFGIAKMRSDGSGVNTVLGFKGKNAKGQSNKTIARQVESGTSWLQKYPFIRNAKNQSKSAAENAMSETFKKEIDRIMGGF